MTIRRRSTIAGVLIAVLAATAGCARDERSTADSGQAVERFVTAIDALREDARIPGLSVAVVQSGEVVIATGLGHADLERSIPATEDTHYDIASVSKPLSAVVALRLAEQGLVDLDRPIAEYSDWVEFCKAFRQQPSIFARELECDPPVHTLRHLFSHTAAGRPGDGFSYNPILFSWASRPIMAATGKSFSDLVSELVFVPAGMNRSARRHRALPLPEEIASNQAPPHRIDDSGALVRAPALTGQGDGAAGGVVSTVVDLTKFDRALDDDLLLSTESRVLMMSPFHSNAGRPLAYGIGWYVQDYQGMQLVWHSGWWEDAYSALYLKVPERRATLILLANSEGLWWGNPLTEARVQDSPFAQAFLRIWVGRG